MGLSVGKDKNEVGKFAYELWTDGVDGATVGGFDTMREAEQAGMIAQRQFLAPMMPSSQTLDDILMSDDELLRELGA